jgi:FkbM family methyltransferase
VVGSVLGFDELVKLIFPGLSDPASLAALRAAAEAAGGDISRPETIRRMIGSVDQQVATASMVVRLGPGDVEYREVGGLRLALDRADASVARQVEAAGGYEPHLTAAFRRHCAPGMTVVDVGANIGYYSMLAAQLVGPTGRVYAIEPSSENCRLLLASITANGLENIELLPLACDSRRGWVYLRSHVGSNAGLVPADDVVTAVGTVVPAFRLDELVEGPVHLLKLDVEGAEARVVEGATQLLQRDRPIVTSELSCEMLPRVSGVAVEDYLGGFFELGYRLFMLDKAGGEPVAYESAQALLDSWGDPYRIEDVLLLPH